MCVLFSFVSVFLFFWWRCNMTDLGRTCLILEYRNNMFLQQAMIMKLLYYDHLLYTRWYGQELYYYKKTTNNNTWFVFFWFQEKEKYRIHSNAMFTFFFPTLCCWTFCYNVSLQKPTDRKKLHGQWKTAWALPFKLWINYNTVASF